jgi:BirA family biotin operon repressor/biotin-[acetyl-CoA-carboxylase] ligase
VIEVFRKLDRERIRLAINTSNFEPVIFIESDVDSTNLFAKRLLLKGFDSDAVIISEKQSAGRGRADRTWYSPSGGLYMSLILQGRLKPSMFHLYSFVLALAASIVLEQMVMLQVDLKWPNDLLVSGKKIGGILSELITENLEIPVIILGIGIPREDIALSV